MSHLMHQCLRFSRLHLIANKYDRSVITNLEPRPTFLFYISGFDDSYVVDQCGGSNFLNKPEHSRPVCLFKRRNESAHAVRHDGSACETVQGQPANLGVLNYIRIGCGYPVASVLIPITLASFHDLGIEDILFG